MRKNMLIMFLTAAFVMPAGIGFSYNDAEDNITGDFVISQIDKTVSLDLQAADLIDVLKMLSQQTGLNFISNESVQGRTLTLYLDNVPLKSAVDLIFKANGLTYEYYPDNNIFLVKELGKPDVELKTKVYYLKYARVQSSKLQKESDKLGSSSGSGSSRGGSSAPSAASGASKSGSSSGGTDIKSSVQNLVSDKGKVAEDSLTNALIVTDVVTRFPLIDELISKLDIPTPRVMIEVEMLDVSKRTVDKLGVSWPDALASLDITGTRLTSFPFSNDSKSDVGRVIYNDGTLPTASKLELSNLMSKNFSPSVLTLVGAKLALNFLKSDADTKSLARPKILTLSNETAEIKITTDQAIGISKSEATSTGRDSYTIERSETGTTLRVTPQVDIKTGEITMYLEMTVKEATDSGFVLGDQFVTGTVKDPEERTAKSVLRMKNGNTLIMGGLIKTTDSNSGNSLPFLSKIPFFGGLFRYKNKNFQERELMVFLTPRIITDDDQQFAGLSAQRERGLRREQGNNPKEMAVRLALDKYSR